jgi:hypothetical protein
MFRIDQLFIIVRYYIVYAAYGIFVNCNLVDTRWQ